MGRFLLPGSVPSLTTALLLVPITRLHCWGRSPTLVEAVWAVPGSGSPHRSWASFAALGAEEAFALHGRSWASSLASLREVLRHRNLDQSPRRIVEHLDFSRVRHDSASTYAWESVFGPVSSSPSMPSRTPLERPRPPGMSPAAPTHRRRVVGRSGFSRGGPSCSGGRRECGWTLTDARASRPPPYFSFTNPFTKRHLYKPPKRKASRNSRLRLAF